MTFVGCCELSNTTAGNGMGNEKASGHTANPENNQKQRGRKGIVKLLYYSYKIRKKLEITHRLSRSTILYAYV